MSVKNRQINCGKRTHQCQQSADLIRDIRQPDYVFGVEPWVVDEAVAEEHHSVVCECHDETDEQSACGLAAPVSYSEGDSQQQECQGRECQREPFMECVPVLCHVLPLGFRPHDVPQQHFHRHHAEFSCERLPVLERSVFQVHRECVSGQEPGVSVVGVAVCVHALGGERAFGDCEVV